MPKLFNFALFFFLENILKTYFTLVILGSSLYTFVTEASGSSFDCLLNICSPSCWAFSAGWFFFLPILLSLCEMFKAVSANCTAVSLHSCSWTYCCWLSKPSAVTASIRAPVPRGECSVCSFFCRGFNGNSGHSPPWKPTWAEWTHLPRSSEWSSQAVWPSQQKAKAVSEWDSDGWWDSRTC